MADTACCLGRQQSLAHHALAVLGEGGDEDQLLEEFDHTLVVDVVVVGDQVLVDVDEQLGVAAR